MEDHNLPVIQEDPLVMYLIVNETLNMSVGKTAAQVGHAVQMLALQYMNYRDVYKSSGLKGSEWYSNFKEWLDTSFRKVVLKADAKEWIKIKEVIKDYNMVLVSDNGLTEIAAGSETVIGLFPMRKSVRPKIIKKLQALK